MELKKYVLFLVSVFCLFICLACSKKSSTGPEKKSGLIELTEIDDVLPNPFKGFAPWIGDDNPIYECKLQQATFSWRDLEPVKGQYKWQKLEQGWGNIAVTGKRVGFRIAAAIPGSGQVHTPQWLIDQGVAMRHYSIDGESGLAPDWDDPKFLAAHHDFIMALGAKYDQDARVAWIDIGSYGFWGEWHVWMNESLAGTQATKQAILEDYFTAFPTKPKVIAFDDDFATAYVTEHGGGLRNDCLGEKESNDWYLESLTGIDAQLNEQVWKTAIITGEFCGSDEGAVEGTTERFDLNYNFIKQTHWSFIGSAGGAIQPQNETHRQNLDKLHKTLGYRFVLCQFTHVANIDTGKTLAITLKIENKGVAPFYFQWPLVVYLTNNEGAVILQQVTATDIRTWLPGLHTCELALAIPAETAPGLYEIKLAIHDPATNKPAIMFANTGNDGQLRYLVSRVQVN